MCTIALTTSMPTQSNDDGWKRSLQYAYYNNRQPATSSPPAYAAPPTMTRQQPAYHQPMYNQAYSPSQYMAAPMTMSPPQYHVPADLSDNTSVYALPRQMPGSATSYTDMLALNITDTDYDDVRMLQEMLLTPHTVDNDETKSMEPLLMFRTLPPSTPMMMMPPPPASISQPSTPHSEVSSCDSQAPPMRMARSRKSQRKIPTTRICRVPECNKGIRSRGLCKAHGGGRRCQTPGCTISDQGGGHCIAHGGGKRCTVSGCDKSAQFKGLCKVHGGSRRCRVVDCDKNGQIKGLCRQHYTQSVQENGEDEHY